MKISQIFFIPCTPKTYGKKCVYNFVGFRLICAGCSNYGGRLFGRARKDREKVKREKAKREKLVPSDAASDFSSRTR